MPIMTKNQFEILQEAKNCSLDTVENMLHVHRFLGLSLSETRVAILLADGHSIQEIAGLMNTTENSVRTWSKRIMSKWYVHHQHQIVRLVLHGLPISRRLVHIGPRTLERRQNLRTPSP